MRARLKEAEQKHQQQLVNHGEKVAVLTEDLTQKETDNRLLTERLSKLKKELTDDLNRKEAEVQVSFSI